VRVVKMSARGRVTALRIVAVVWVIFAAITYAVPQLRRTFHLDGDPGHGWSVYLGVTVVIAASITLARSLARREP
jgi:heme/copper-type cytochrome/quinol oxidase subunit 4